MIIVEDLCDLVISSYDEGTSDQLDYYIDERKCDIGDIAYLYQHEDKTLTKMEIIRIIARSDDMEFYDGLSEDVLIEGEDKLNADTSAEFITDNNCYLVWFKYI